MAATFSDQQWAAVDARIFAGNILLAIKVIRGFAGVGIREALDIHIERYRQLRAQSPERFACSHEEYWRDFYS